jgi:gamma-glutamylcyclotransferase (GGCT)/AIG2-like uncharacterized protein YtfP
MKHENEIKKIDLFVYGTLLNDQHVKLLLNRNVKSIPAVLTNYLRVSPSNAFFFIVQQKGSEVFGRLLKDLSPEEIKRIDAFEDEGNLYHRKKVYVHCEGHRKKCETYIGSIEALQRTFDDNSEFEDRYEHFIEKEIDDILKDMPNDRPDINRRVIRELSGLEADSIIQSHFDGNYICKYIMIQVFKEAKPPSLQKILENRELMPYAGNYLRFACQHIIFNQFAELIRHDFCDRVRVSQQYYRHGLAILLSFLFYNQNSETINKLIAENRLDEIVPGRSYRDYAAAAVNNIVDCVYEPSLMKDIIDYVDENWYSTPTPIGAELEFSFLGKNTLNAKPGEDKMYDGFYWFNDFDMMRRTWRLGGHIDSHRNITADQKRHRGFFEYALGRYQILGDLSRPLFDCPWAMSLVINEAVKFLNIPPHSLHVSMELSRGQHSHITDRRHKEENLICLLMLGGDIKFDDTGWLREWRIHNEELDTNFKRTLHFSDRKYHFSRPDQEESEASDTMEYKFMRLHKHEHDYEKIIVALKGYQFETHARPISVPKPGEKELPEQVFIREWAKNPQALDKAALSNFLRTLEKGLLEENRSCKLDNRKRKILEEIEKDLIRKNRHVAEHQGKYIALK